MKRYPVVIGATIAGVAGVLSYHTQPQAQSALASPTSHAATPPAASTKGRTSASASTTPTPHTQSPPTTSTTAPPSASHTALGKKEQYGYGVLSVRVTAQGNTITDVALATLQTADTYSTQLADAVVPYLKREVLHAQSAHISAITGATYTSEAYAMSLQSALDKLRR